jgi:hypothetical protein
MNTESNRNSFSILAIILIVIGGLWLLGRIGFFPHFYLNLNDFVFPIRHIFNGFGYYIFSLPVILIIIGLVLLAGGRNKGGMILIVIGGILLVQRLFVFSGFAASLIFPLILIGVGFVLIVRRL